MVTPIKDGLHRFKTRITQIFCLVIACWLLVTLAQAQRSAYVRVAIIQDSASLNLKVNSFYEVLDSKTNKVLYKGKGLRTTVTAFKGGIVLGRINFNADKVLIKANDPEAIVINGRRFRGMFEFIKKNNLHLLVINHIELEDYIKGVLYNEASHYWPQEALKALAVACRTFALNRTQENKSRDFDVTSDIYSQVYGGKSSERYRTNKAVEKTQGLVLTYNGKIFPAYYHATCAGKTEDASILWNIDIAPLKGVNCGFCSDSPHYKWHAVLSSDEIREKLGNNGHNIKNIKDIVILARDTSGRVANLKIVSDEKEIEISAKDLRIMLGPNIIRSTNFTAHVVNNDVVFEGLGWGHGVGMCQWGAYFMAKQGKGFEEILKYYYPGSNVETFRF
jgi:stage II sporulation protein D